MLRCYSLQYSLLHNATLLHRIDLVGLGWILESFHLRSICLRCLHYFRLRSVSLWGLWRLVRWSLRRTWCLGFRGFLVCPRNRLDGQLGSLFQYHGKFLGDLLWLVLDLNFCRWFNRKDNWEFWLNHSGKQAWLYCNSSRRNLF